MEKEITACPHCKKKERDEAEYKSLLNRLSRIEGQIRGLRGMLEDDAYCIDIINQANAAASAISAFNRELLASHIKSCVADDVKNGEGTTVDELVATLSRMIK
ncbi:MAG: metal-sensing transcriptional repressor [Clostridia bacterium]|nr:metal-sensing transcriptional repressor [Clostridia bacterium]